MFATVVRLGQLHNETRLMQSTQRVILSCSNSERGNRKANLQIMGSVGKGFLPCVVGWTG